MTDHRAKYRLVAMMEKIIDIQTQTSPVSVHQVNSLDKEFRGCESFSALMLTIVKSTVPEALLPNTPIQDLPLDPSVHPHMVSFFLMLLSSGHTSSRAPTAHCSVKTLAQPPSFRPSNERGCGPVKLQIWRELCGIIRERSGNCAACQAAGHLSSIIDFSLVVLLVSCFYRISLLVSERRGYR